MEELTEIGKQVLASEVATRPPPPPQEIDPAYCCQLSGKLMEDPVITPYNTCFDRENIERWLEQHSTCPITHKPLDVDQLRECRTLKIVIAQFLNRER